jgi:cytochrome c oxidase subunit 2
MWGVPLFPEQASTVAGRVDALFIFLIALTVFFTTLIFGAVVVLAIRYRRRAADEIPAPLHPPLLVEITWTIVPFFIVMFIFAWGASVYITIVRPPADALQVYAIGKRWMWKFQHGAGQREINELHVPLGAPVKITVASEDVIHSLYVPAFRVKVDAVPGRYSTMWFEATKEGRYHLFCAEYCGTNHSRMIGSVIVMAPENYQAWLSEAPATGSMVQAGEQLFQQLACTTCHRGDTQGRGPVIGDLYGATVKLVGGGTVTADEAYLRESILNPTAKLVEGYPPLMPTFQGLVSEEGVLQIIAYMKSLSAQAPERGAVAAPAAGRPAPGAARPKGTS